jgi:hypothetical protein
MAEPAEATRSLIFPLLDQIPEILPKHLSERDARPPETPRDAT